MVLPLDLAEDTEPPPPDTRLPAAESSGDTAGNAPPARDPPKVLPPTDGGRGEGGGGAGEGEGEGEGWIGGG
jgi:hypothetical protein